MDINTGADGLALYLSGGASNVNPSAALGGVISSQLIKGMSAVYTSPVQGLMIEDASPDNGAGTASISIDSDGDATYTPPGGSAGPAVTVAAGARKILTGADTDNYVRVYRQSGMTWSGTAEFSLVDMLTGVFSMSDVNDADRQAGEVHYRGSFLKARENVQDIAAWITTDGQAAYALASETPVADEIQEIANEETAPTSVSWVNAVTRATAISLEHLLTDATIGLWIRRTFPAVGTVAPKEQVTLNLEFKGA